MDTAVNSVISSINAHERKLGVTSNNVANVNTNGFKRKQAVLQEGPVGDVRVHVRQDNSPAPEDPLAPDAPGVEKELSNVNLVDEMTSLVPTTVGYKANLKVIRARDEMIGNLLDTLA
ncbi:MAG: flagellar basal body rod C-terminal domain-containing protein [Desulfobacterales bacterium]|nr:flagellar basal body rod C-terminal domain-containing protein [Desulfobacterales bacterium]MDJ0884316.1 flagellar basal body rod C-terminal domain-containing protein [Desulfobacterales bacterium]